MFYEVCPLLISLAKFSSCALLLVPESPVLLQCDLTVSLCQMLAIGSGQSRQCGDTQPYHLLSYQHRTMVFLLHNPSLPEILGLSVSLAKSSRLGPKSLRHNNSDVQGNT